MRIAGTALILVSLIVANGWRAYGFYAQAAVMRTYDATVDPLWLLVFALGWAALFCGLLIMVVRRAAWVKWGVPFVFLLYGLWMAVRPTPIFPLLILHLLLAAFTFWRLRSMPSR